MAVIKVSLRVLLTVWVLGFTWAVDDEELIWKCGRENGLETDTIVLLNETRNTPIVVENEMIKCFFKCIFEETKWMSSEGKLQVGTYDDENRREEFEHIVIDCMSVKGDYPCETAYLFQQCIFTKKVEEEEEEESEEQQEEGKQEQEQQEEGQETEKGEEKPEPEKGQQEQGEPEKGKQEEDQQEKGQEEEQQEEQQNEN